MNLQWCPDSIPQLFGLFDLSIAPQLLFYTYVPVIVVSLLIGLYVLTKDAYSLRSKLLFGVSAFFTIWTIDIFFTWIAAYHSHVMLAWHLTPIIECGMFVLSLWFVYVFIDKNHDDISDFKKYIFLLIVSPVLLLLPTKTNISYFDLSICEGHLGPLWYYLYFIEVVFIVWIIAISVRQAFFEKDIEWRKQIIFMMVGMVLFLGIFFGSNVVGQYMQIQEISFFGSLGMVVFLAFLAYLIVKFRAFNVKLIGVQVLVMTQFVFIGSMFFFTRSFLNYILVSMTLVITLGAGWSLIRSVRKEVERKEELQMISDSLAAANERLRRLDNAKSEFISIASHQLRTPLTAIKGYISLVLEGSYGKVSPEVEDVLEKVYGVQGQLAQLVEDLLNVSRIESGRIQYQFAPARLEILITDLIDMFSIAAKDKGIALRMHLSKRVLPELTIDTGKIRETLSNLIDNAVKYTPQGGEVKVSLEGDDERRMARVIVEDNGVGISPEDKVQLFEKFVRSKETTKLVTSGTGLGLYVGKNFVEAHGGRIWAESEGHGKGSRFIVELPYEYSATGRDEVATFGKSYESSKKD